MEKMKLYRDMTPEERAQDDAVVQETFEILKWASEIIMAEYDRRPREERDLMKEGF